MVFTTIYSIITNKYPHKKTALLGMLEATFGIGLIFGPLAGALLFNQFGFEKTFYIYGTAFLCCVFCIYYFTEPIKNDHLIPVTGMSETGGYPAVKSSSNRLSHETSNKSQIIDESDASSNDIASNSTDADDQDKISYRSLLMNPNYVMAALAGCVAQFIYAFMEPILAKRLEDLDLT